MGYKEKLKDYAEGRLEGKEKENVESDIERQRAIGNYLEESLDSEIFEESNDAEDKHTGDDSELSKIVQKAVGRKLRKFGLWTGAVVLAVTMFLMFGLSPLMDAMYYDPGVKITKGEFLKNIIDPGMVVFSDLRCTGKGFTGSECRGEGFGKYSVTLNFYSSVYGQEKYDVTMDKGVFDRSYLEWLGSSPTVFFIRANTKMWHYKLDDSADIAVLEKLPETALVTACINFKEDISLSEVKELDPDNKLIEYVVVRVNKNESMMDGGYFGYSTAYEHLWYYNIKGVFDNETYPDLNIAEQWPNISEQTWESHFKSMLRYFADQKDLNKALGSDPKVYTDALQYVEENGVKAYGVLVTAPVGDLLALRQDSRVESMFVLDAKLAKFGNAIIYR